MDVIELKEVGKSFKKNIILRDVSFNVSQGDVFGIVGPSGSGKSVLIKMLIGFLEPDKGSLKVKSSIGFSMQNNSLYDTLTLRQNLNYFAKIYGVKNKRDRIDYLIESLSLVDFEWQLVGNLSGGTKKRVDLACALLNSPEILVLDEPFVGLDSRLVRQLMGIFKSLNEGGVTIVFSSHMMEYVKVFCKKVFFVENKTGFLISPEQLEEVYS